jgi:hypothetical protein
MGMQSAAVKWLKVEGVFTTVASATVILLMENITAGPMTGSQGWRLAGVVVSLFAGATATVLVHTPICAPVLPFGTTIVMAAAAAIVW